MTVYEYAEAALGAFCSEHALAYRAEWAAAQDGLLPERYLLMSVVSDNDSGFADNRAARRKYRVQIDLCVPEAERSTLPALFTQAEIALIRADFRPQGNFRMATDEKSRKAYVQKDFLIAMEVSGIWGC